MPASSVLLLSADPASAELVAGVLAGVGYEIEIAVTPGEALRKAVDRHLIIIDVVSGPRSGPEICREIRVTPELASIPILCVAQNEDVEDRIRFLEAGADDVMARPFDGRELEARVDALLLRLERSRDLSPSGSGGTVITAGPNRVATVFSPKGGVGTTTIAVNLALVESRGRPDKVAIVDLDPQFGQVATHLNLEVRQSLAELLRDEVALREPDLLRTYALRHDSGLHVLAAPPTPEISERIEPSVLEQLFETILGVYETIIVDGGSVLDRRALAVLGKSNVVIIPVLPEIAALKAVRTMFDYLADTSSLVDKMRFVLNIPFAREILRLRDVESALGTKVEAVIPYDSFLYLKAVNEGVPVVLGAPRSAPADRLTKLAGSILGAPEMTASAPLAARRPRLPRLVRRSSSRS